MKVEKGLLYAMTHEWVRLEGNEAFVGISDFAQLELNDVVYVELPMPGETFKQGERFGAVESVKAASDVYLPLSGEIIAVNGALQDNPALVNQQPYRDGWFVKMRASDPAEAKSLMEAGKYEQFIADSGH